MSYNYEKNILELSETNDINEVPKEWVSLAPSHRVDEKERCICNRRIIIMERFFNTITKRVINVGTKCVKGLRLNKCKSVDSVIKSFIDGEPGEYQQILDLIKYSDDNLQKVIASVKQMANSSWNNPEGLIEIKRIISILSENGIVCRELHSLLIDLQKRIDYRAQLAETHRLWIEKMNRENAERAEQQRIISEAKRIEEQERLERQREVDKIVQEKNRLAQLEELRYRESLRDPVTLKRLQREEEIRAYNAKKATT